MPDGHTILFATAGVLTLINAGLVMRGLRRHHFWSAACTAGLGVINLLTLLISWHLIQMDQMIAACKGAPPVVPYHDGMTLCPGQSTTIQIPLPVPTRSGTNL